MTTYFPAPLRLTLISSRNETWAKQLRELERILTSSAAGIGWDLGELESPKPGEEGIGEHFEIRSYQRQPKVAPGRWLDATLHSLVVVLADEELLKDRALMKWLRKCAQHVQKSDDRHYLMVVPAHDGIKTQWLAESNAFAARQVRSWSSLEGEEAGRLDQLALRVLDRLIKLMARDWTDEYGWKLRIFLSHAKLDGFYLAQSFRSFLCRQTWLEHFYDARDIADGEDWKKALQAGVKNSVLLVLRTDGYEGRLYCRREVQWATQYAVPRVVVDARSGLVHPASTLSLDAAPAVRVPDGNLPRVLFAVQQTALRSFLFRRRVLELARLKLLPKKLKGVQVVPVRPTLDALQYALQEVRRGGRRKARWVLYPDPPLGKSLQSVSKAMAKKAGARLLTPRQLLSGSSK